MELTFSKLFATGFATFCAAYVTVLLLYPLVSGAMGMLFPESFSRILFWVTVIVFWIMIFVLVVIFVALYYAIKHPARVNRESDYGGTKVSEAGMREKDEEE